MLARCARVEPARMRTLSPSWPPSNFTMTFLSACSTATPSLSARLSEPFAPFTVTTLAATLTVTPLGRSITRFATQDMFASLARVASGHDAQHLGALPDGARGLVGH